MVSLDRALVLRKLAEFDSYLGQLAEFSEVSEEDYGSDWKTQRIIDRTLQLVIECCTDIANHVISTKRLPVPTSYANVFAVLGEAGLLPSELAETMGRIARFRNILGHQYTAVDSRIVVSVLRTGSGDLHAYREAVLSWCG